MHSGKVDDFLFHMTYKRFRATLREFAESDGINSEFVDTVLERYLANPSALGNILAQYTDRQAELRVGCLLRASKEVHREITEHFESNRKETPKALIHEMPTDKYLRLKLQSEYIVRYVRGIDEDELPKFREAALLRDKLLEAIKQVERLKIDREEISQQIQAVVKDEVASLSVEISRLSHEMELAQNETKKLGDKVEAARSRSASIEELQGLKDVLHSEVQSSNQRITQVLEELQQKPSRTEVEELRSRITANRETVDEFNRREKLLSDQLKSLADRMLAVVASAASSHEDVERTVQSLFEAAKVDLERAFQTRLNGGTHDCDEFKKLMDLCVGTVASAKDLNDVRSRVEDNDNQREQIKRAVEKLNSRMENFASREEWIDEMNRVLEKRFQNYDVALAELHPVIESIGSLRAQAERLSGFDGHDLEAHARIEAMMTKLATIEDQFPGLEQKLESLFAEHLATQMAREWEKMQSEKVEKWLNYSLGRITKARGIIAKAQGRRWDLDYLCRVLRDEKQDPNSEDFIELVKLLWPVPTPKKKLLERIGNSVGVKRE